MNMYIGLIINFFTVIYILYNAIRTSVLSSVNPAFCMFAITEQAR